jgi:plasmid maintenance system antidote protein VapI
MEKHMTRIPKEFPNDQSGQLFDFLRQKYKLNSDKELSAKIDVLPHTISRIRNAKQGVTSEARYRISKTTGMTVKAIDKLIEGEE